VEPGHYHASVSLPFLDHWPAKHMHLGKRPLGSWPSGSQQRGRRAALRTSASGPSSVCHALLVGTIHSPSRQSHLRVHAMNRSSPVPPPPLELAEFRRSRFHVGGCRRFCAFFSWKSPHDPRTSLYKGAGPGGDAFLGVWAPPLRRSSFKLPRQYRGIFTGHSPFWPRAA